MGWTILVLMARAISQVPGLRRCSRTHLADVAVLNPSQSQSSATSQLVKRYSVLRKRGITEQSMEEQCVRRGAIQVAMPV